MSKINRSTYQKLKEENKHLLKDIKDIVMYHSQDVVIKWHNHFKKEEQFNRVLKEAAKRYIKEHADELPDFLTSI